MRNDIRGVRVRGIRLVGKAGSILDIALWDEDRQGIWS